MTGSATKKDQPVIVQDRHSTRRYVKGRFLGKGGFAKCYMMTDLDTKKVYAGKVVSKATLSKYRAKEKLTTEIKIHKSLKHEHVVGFHRFFEDRENVYILLELCSNQSLMDLHKRRRALTEPEVRYYLKQIIEGTRYMHNRSVIHRDLKLGNLFLNDHMQVKIGDFGLATTVTYDGERKKTLCGTPNYIAPEILDRKGGHSFEVDVWSIGCILYTLLIGKPPFETNNIENTYRKIQTNDYKIPSTPVISEDAKDLIRQTLHAVPASRPTMETILDHPFFTKHFIPESLPTSALTVAPKLSDLTAAAPAAAYPAKKLAADTPSRKPLGVLNTDSPGVKKADQQLHQSKSNLVVPTISVTPAAAPAAAAAAAAPSAAASQPPLHATAKAPPPLPSLATATAPALPLPSSASSPPASPTATSLEEIQARLRDVTSRQAAAPTDHKVRAVPAHEARNGLWISKWVDYSNKYGLGYQLSDGTVGVLFNDSTKMMLSPNNHGVEFIDREGRSSDMTIDAYPQELHKKITLLKYFKNYMNEHLLNGGDASQAAAAGQTLSHVKKWIRTKHAIVFRLSAGVIQVNFFDHTKLIINTPQDLVTYIDKDKVSSTFWLEDVAASNHPAVQDLASRLFYATDIVGHLVSSKKP